MDKIPSPFWAALLALMGTGLVLAVLYHPTPENIALAVLTVGSNLVSGALGYIAHAAMAKSNVTSGDGSVSIDPK